MGKYDSIVIQGVKFTIIQRLGIRMLVSWTENNGITKQRWVKIPQTNKAVA